MPKVCTAVRTAARAPSVDHQCQHMPAYLLTSGEGDGGGGGGPGDKTPGPRHGSGGPCRRNNVAETSRLQSAAHKVSAPVSPPRGGVLCRGRGV